MSYCDHVYCTFLSGTHGWSAKTLCYCSFEFGESVYFVEIWNHSFLKTLAEAKSWELSSHALACLERKLRRRVDVAKDAGACTMQGACVMIDKH